MQVSIKTITEGSTKEFLQDINDNFSSIGQTLGEARNIFSGTEDPNTITVTDSQNGDIYIQYATK